MTKSETNFNPDLHFNSDQPIKDKEKDHFGFAKIAENLVRSICKDANQDGIVIGIEGSWGSGKSSLVELLCLELENNKNKAQTRFVKSTRFIDFTYLSI